MLKVKVVTGYVPIPNHPRSAATYGKLGEEAFRNLPCPVRSYYWPLSRTWLQRQLDICPFEYTHSVGDNPAKNSVAYHCVNHQKFEWLAEEAMLDPDPDVFVWIDYGILHVPGITATVIRDFLGTIKPNDLAIPGCTREPGLIHDEQPCWRFCGGLIVCPRDRTVELSTAVKENAIAHIKLTRNVSWEVNTLARVEKQGNVPIRWYQADHNETMFTGYNNAVSEF